VSGDRPLEPVEVVRHQWIPMEDGCRLAARLWLPAGARKQPVPAILEYIPYRKNDATARRDEGMHPYFAARGYASVRVDLRGSGDSDGTLEDEYLPLEQRDGLEVLRWLADQVWCSGRVGIIGKSWGGFNGLQVAAHSPPQLAAVISVCSTDDRYGPDIHYAGGCLLADSALSWATTMLAYNARPPDPQVLGPSWRETWLGRMGQASAFAPRWLAHQRRDDYWKQGSVCEDWSAIRCPVYMVGGWEDPYRSAVLRFLANQQGMAKGLIGPWAHCYPHEGLPGPPIDFLEEAVRWWDRWLKGIQNGISDEPRLRLFIEASRPARSSDAQRQGRWVSEPGWPSPHVRPRSWYLGPGGTLSSHQEAPSADWLPVTGGTEACGQDSGVYLAFGAAGEGAADQRAEDGRSLCFTTPPLEQDLDVVGEPVLALRLAADRPAALVAARICDVWPDGSSTLITRGLLNLTHRDSHERPQPLEPGRSYPVSITLDAIAYSLPAGHRLRLALSPTYWPWAWPSPEPVILSLAGEGRLELPVREGEEDEGDGKPPRHFGPPPATRDDPAGQVTPVAPAQRQVHRDLASGWIEITTGIAYFPPRRVDGTGLEYGETGRDCHRIREGDPLSAETRSERCIDIGRPGWRTRVEARSSLSSTKDDLIFTAELEAWEADNRVFARTWDAVIPREAI
jgi:putative CocE/NonD family hydrolase